MTPAELGARYRAYLDCLNARDWDSLGDHVHPRALHNGRPLGLSGYRRMLEGDVAAIPDLRFTATGLVVEPPMLAARLDFDCTPVGRLFDLPVNGRRVRFAEHVFYRWREGLIHDMRSLTDVDAIAAQLKDRG